MNLLARITAGGKEQTLPEHLDGVRHKCRYLLDQKALNVSRVSQEEIVEIGEIIGAAHDFGKGTTYFQDYLHDNYQGRKKRHSSLSAYFAYDTLTRAGYSDETALLGWIAVQRHHGDLRSVFTHGGEIYSKADDPNHKSLLREQISNIRNNTQSELEQYYAKAVPSADISTFIERVDSGDLFEEFMRHKILLSDEYTPEDYYLLLFLYSVLLDADRVDSAGITLDKWPSVGSINQISTDAVKQYREQQLSVDTKLDQQRQNAAETVSSAVTATPPNQQLYSITMPTGSGKTLTALDTALMLRGAAQTDRPPRIIYAAPFLSIIDQNYDVIKSVLKTTGHTAENPDVLLRHDHRSPGYAKVDQDPDIEIGREFLQHPDRQLLLTEGWDAEVVTTTFVQLFNTLLTKRSKNARRFHKLAGSVILIDEIQAIPPKYWEPVKRALKILSSQFNTQVILLTATNPLLFDAQDEVAELSDSTHTPAEVSPPDFSQFNRVTYCQKYRETTQTIPELATWITELCETEPQKDIMAVLNTVTATEEVYDHIQGSVDRDIVYLSTRVLSGERAKRIEQIKQSDDPILVITTQLVEAGVDIDLDIVIRDFAPIDCLVQTAGRCNREAVGEGGTVYITKLRDTRDNAPRQYHYQYVYDAVLTDVTRDVLSEYPISVPEQTFNSSAITEYFEGVKTRKATDKGDILESMKSLDLGEINPSLIEKTYQTVPIYIMRDRAAEEIYDKLKLAYDSGETPNDKPLSMLKAKFYENTVSVPVGDDEQTLAHLPSTFIDELKLVERKHVGSTESDWYHTVTGFQIPDDHIGLRII